MKKIACWRCSIEFDSSLSKLWSYEGCHHHHNTMEVRGSLGRCGGTIYVSDSSNNCVWYRQGVGYWLEYPLCSRCGSNPKSIVHLHRECHASRSVWNKLRIPSSCIFLLWFPSLCYKLILIFRLYFTNTKCVFGTPNSNPDSVIQIQNH